MKSGVVFPRGSSLTYWVIITPGTLDLFLISTLKIYDLIIKLHQSLHYVLIMVKCFNIGKNIGKPIYRTISSQYLDGRPPGKTRLLLVEVLVRPAGGAHPVVCVGPNAPV